MKLSTSDKVKLFAAFGAALISIFAHILVREWYQPDVRYEVGSHYISGSTAITSLKLINVGHADAEQIRIAAAFNNDLTEVTSDNNAIPLKVIKGGINQKRIIGEIERLVPQQEIYLYFALDYHDDMASDLNKNFMQEVTFKGGKGKTGEPLWSILFGVVGAILICIPTMYFFDKYMNKRLGLDTFDKDVDIYHEKIIELISLAETFIAKGKPLEEFEQRVNYLLLNHKFRKEGLQKIAIKKYMSLEERNKSNIIVGTDATDSSEQVSS